MQTILNEKQIQWLNDNVRSFKPWQGWPANVKSRGRLPHHQQLLKNFGPVGKDAK